MIIEIRAKNCFAFDEQITFSMKADMRNKKFASNVHKKTTLMFLRQLVFMDLIMQEKHALSGVLRL